MIGVGFDFDHTLGIDNKLERVAFLRLLELLISVGGSPLGTLDEETKQIDDLLALQRSGAFSIDNAVERFCRPRLPGAEVRSYIPVYKQFALAGVAHFVVPVPGAGELLQTLRRKGVRCAILTNGWSPLQEQKAARIGFNGPVIVSEKVGAQKPESKAFDALVDALNVSRENVWYVGDNPVADVAGSLDCGLRAVWFDAENVAYPADIARPTAVIRDLKELPSVLEQAEPARHSRPG